jgi:hypothetical protein
MRKRSVTLTELQDLALAACDDEHLRASAARWALTSWLGREVPFRELRSAYGRLLDLGFLRTYRERQGRAYAAPFVGTRTRDLAVRATPKGRAYLKRRPRHVV